MEEIQTICKYQSEILSAEPVSFDEFDRCVDEKDVCLEQLEKLDEGFELVYERVSGELKEHRAEYADWIAQTQKLIADIMDKSVAIQTQEERNKQAVEKAFQKERREYGKGKRSVQVARDYYRNMSNTGVVPPQFMDKRNKRNKDKKQPPRVRRKVWLGEVLFWENRLRAGLFFTLKYGF